MKECSILQVLLSSLIIMMMENFLKTACLLPIQRGGETLYAYMPLFSITPSFLYLSRKSESGNQFRFARPPVCLSISDLVVLPRRNWWRDGKRTGHGELPQYYRNVMRALPWTKSVSSKIIYLRGTTLRRAGRRRVGQVVLSLID